MSDFRLVWNNDTGSADLALRLDDVLGDDGLETAVQISLFVDRRVGDERGWWGDLVSDVPGDVTGSRLWTLARERDAARVLREAPGMLEEALAWMVEDGVASSVQGSAELRPGGAGVTEVHLSVTIHRPVSAPAVYRYAYNWATQQARRS